MIVEYIDAHREELGVDPICRVLTEQASVQIAPSTYYAAKQQGLVSAADLDDAYNANTVFDLWVANRRVYGVRKLWHAAKRAGHGWGRDRVGRLMRIAGIDGVVRGKRTTRTIERDEQAPAAASRPDRSCLVGADASGSVVGGGFYVCVDAARVLLHRVLRGRVLPPHPRLAGDDQQDHGACHVGARAGAIHPPLRRVPFHRNWFGA